LEAIYTSCTDGEIPVYSFKWDEVGRFDTTLLAHKAAQRMKSYERERANGDLVEYFTP
jgi:hypothetical protein